MKGTPHSSDLRTYKCFPVVYLVPIEEKFRNDVFQCQISIMYHKLISRRGPSESGAEVGVGGPLDGLVKDEWERLLDLDMHLHLCGRFGVPVVVLS